MNVISTPIATVPRKRISFHPEFFWVAFVLFPLCFLLIYASDGFSGKNTDSYVAPNIPANDSIVTVTLSFAGDLMCHTPQISNSKKADGTYDFNPSFKEIAPFLSSADVTMANLECTFAGKGRPYGGYPAFNSPDEYLSAVKNSGIDFLVTSNNHSMDTGEEGLQRTLKKVRENNFGSTGTFDSKRDRDSIRVLDVKGVKIAVLNYTYGTNGAYPSSSKKWMLNVADSALVHDDVLRARKTEADIVLVFYHWGIENKQSPVAKQDTMFHWAADAGADLIIGAHPHVLEPVTYYKTAPNAKLDSGIVAWSLGNFLSNQYWRYTDAGVILNISIEKNLTTGKMQLQPFTYVPTWVYRAYDPSLLKHVIVPATWCESDSLPKWINGESKTKMCEAFSDTRLMMSKDLPSPKSAAQPKNKEMDDILQKIKEREKRGNLWDTTMPGGNGNGDGHLNYGRILITTDVTKLDTGSCMRYIIWKPSTVNTTQEQGNVEMALKIGKDGKVISAEVGKQNTASAAMIATAKQIAYQLKFNEASTCSEAMSIVVTFNFMLK